MPGLIYDIILKIPLIFSDVLTTIFVYKIVLKYYGNERDSIFASALWFLNPFTIWISSGWGTFDTLPTLFTVIAFFLVLEKRFALAGISLVVSIAIKYYAAVLIIPVLFLAWRFGGKKATTKYVIGVGLSSLTLFLPYYAGIPSSLTLVTSTSENALHYSGISIWTVFTLFYPGLNQNVISYFILTVLFIGLYFWIWKTTTYRSDPNSVLKVFVLPIICLLLFFHFIGENFLIWIIPFVAILALKDSLTLKILWGLSILGILSSLTDSLLPYYMLPDSPWIGSLLVHALTLAAPYKVASGGTITQGISIKRYSCHYLESSRSHCCYHLVFV